ncbi:MAG: hypothetical protein H6695_07110 [Deferribacteres bacterium]|nr:hypothetical protein [candidate division KSB1 bacterium]MCB9509931.1 hypothetical protein [Deferribacteres bacterium]
MQSFSDFAPDIYESGDVHAALFMQKPSPGQNEAPLPILRPADLQRLHLQSQPPSFL